MFFLFDRFHGFKKLSFLFLSLIFLIVRNVYAQPPAVALENDYFRYVIAPDGKNLNFIDKQTGVDYCDHTTDSYCASVTKGGKVYPVSSIEQEGENIKLVFGGARSTIDLKTTISKKYITIEVVSVNVGSIDALTFLNVPLTLKALPDEPFAVCALALNIYTSVEQLPALQSQLWATCYEQFGIKGAKVSLIGIPQTEIIPAIKEVMMNAPEIPHSTSGGAWAKEKSSGYGSYLLSYGKVTEETVDEWIAMVKGIGFNQLDIHGTFRWGDFYVDPVKWPKGPENFKNINKRFHDAGIEVIFHTYCYFIDKKSKYVTPIPHPQLGAFRSFTLSEPVSEKATEIPVVESTADISLLTGFHVENSVTLHLGNELVTYTGVTRTPPYKFTGCTRGACGTVPAVHQKGKTARHLRERFNLFVPEPGTELWDEIIKTQAEIVNYCGFDGIYMDAIDGSGVLKGPEHYWYYGTKYIFDMCKYLKNPVGMEMSAMKQQWWHFRSRWQAWDSAVRGFKRFVDIHLAAIKTESSEHGTLRENKPFIDKYAPFPGSRVYLPLQLGWWIFTTWNPPQIEPTFTDDIEYLGCKMIGSDAGLSLHGGVDNESFQKYPAFKRFADILKKYEPLRQSHYFDESVKQRLREPGKDFTLFQDTDGKWKFRSVQYDKHRVEGLTHQSNTWKVDNPFKNQAVKVRIEALMSVKPYDAPENVTLTDFSNGNDFREKIAADGVTHRLEPSSEQVKAGTVSGCFTAKNSGKVSQDAAWAKVNKFFNPFLDIGKNQAVGVWIYGDGNGELLNIRLQNNVHIINASNADHYVKIDFTGILRN
ncbi:MAG: hypothetical protein M1426_00465, partial [Patescibacteria group bacterium]|nr:hypothetical protein [Patescibacteria group bacterium]